MLITALGHEYCKMRYHKFNKLIIQKDEYVEVTPNSLRLRKIYLDENERKRNAKQYS